MARMVVVTPSFRGDYELCADLNKSVLRFAEPGTEHHIIVPRRDLALFDQLRGPHTIVTPESDFLPRSFIPLPFVNFTINVRRPYLPIRGWIIQQIIKLAAAARASADVVVLVDSDIEFVRPFGSQTFMRDGVVRFYRLPDGIDETLPRHAIWNRVSCDLVGIKPIDLPMPDYISSLLAWSPDLVRELLDRIEKTTGTSWPTAVGSLRHFSEWTLYGVYVDRVAEEKARSFMAETTLCHSYWERIPFDDESAAEFVRGINPHDVAVMISTKSRTPVAVRRRALGALANGQTEQTSR